MPTTSFGKHAVSLLGETTASKPSARAAGEATTPRPQGFQSRSPFFASSRPRNGRGSNDAGPGHGSCARRGGSGGGGGSGAMTWGASTKLTGGAAGGGRRAAEEHASSAA